MRTGSEFADMKGKIDGLIDKALTDKSQVDAIMAHYRVSGLYHYSLLNSLMICLQGGTLCQSYKGWQSVGRFVRKGERAHIVIWRPAVTRQAAGPAAKTEDDPETDAGQGGQDGGAKQATGEEWTGNFWLCKVFDVSQTDGEPIKYDHNTAVSAAFEDAQFRQAATALGFHVEEILLTGARGYTDGKKIVLSSISNAVDKTNTLFHEMGHCLLHHGAANKRDVPKDAREVEAEVVSHLCCSFFGIPYELSATYVGAYIDGREHVRKSRCIRAAQKIIAAVLGR